MSSDVGLGILGPVEVCAADRWVTLPPQERLVLALLALGINQVIPVGELIDAVWHEAPPASPRASLQVVVTHLRKVLVHLPGGVIERYGDGYQLSISPYSTDLQQFRLIARRARTASSVAEAVEAFDQALALWRGPALADVPATPKIEAICCSLEEERFSVKQDRISTLLDLGQNQQAVEELTALMATHPLAERLAKLLMVGLYRCGRQADALQVFRDLRRRLSSELAIEPGRELQSLHQQILANDVEQSVTTGWSVRPVGQLAEEQVKGLRGKNSLPVPRQLPMVVARFTGRTAELRVLDSLLKGVDSTGGTVTIAAVSGPAGVGKTTLALHWAHRVAEMFPDGQLYVDLRTFGHSRGPLRLANALRGLLDALDVAKAGRPTGVEAQAALYRTVLASKRMLVVLDNVADEGQVRWMLPGAPGCLVLVTSRRRLTGLAVSEGATLLSLDMLPQAEAVEFLATRIGTQLAEAERATADQLVTLCGGLPLALAVVAVRAAARPNLDLAELSAQMQDIAGRLDMLDSGEQGRGARASFSWSYKSLSPVAARMFRLLGLHPGPDIGLGAAASLFGCPASDASRILAELDNTHVITEHVPARWKLHNLMRAYARERAQCDDDKVERDAAISRVLDYYIQTAWSADVMLRPGRDPAFPALQTAAGVAAELFDSTDEATAWYDAEHPVLVEVISWAASMGFDAYAWRLPWAITDYLALQGRWRTQAVIMQTALEAAQRAGDLAGQARAHFGLGCCPCLPDYEDVSLGHLDLAVELYQGRDDLTGQAAAHFQSGIILDYLGRTQEALFHAKQGLTFALASGHRGHQATALNLVGWLCAQMEQYELALKLCEEALILYRDLGDRAGEAITLDSIGYISHQLGKYSLAEKYYQRAFQLSQAFGCPGVQAVILDHLGDNCEAVACSDDARNSWQQALSLIEDLDAIFTSGIRRKLLALGQG